jgi:hypothetical protein
MVLASTALVEETPARADGRAGAGAPDTRMLQVVRAAAHAAECQTAVFFRGVGPDFEATVAFGAAAPPGPVRLGGAPATPGTTTP